MTYPFKIKLGSAPTEAGILDVIARFYAGERKMIQATPHGWTVHRADGSQIPSVGVRLVRGRYVFGSF